MKKFIILFVMLAASQATLAAELLLVAEAENGTYKVKYSAERTCDTRVTIKDDAGNRIFSEVIRNQCSFIRPYNFSQLPYGRYIIIATNSYSEKVTYVDHQPEEVKSEVVVYKVVRLKDGRYLLQIPKTTHKQLSITIIGNEGLLHTKTIKPAGDFACLYKFRYVANPASLKFEVTAVN